MTRRAACFLAVLPLVAQTRADLSQATAADLEKIVSREMARLNIPGASLAVVLDGRIRYANGFGLADLENDVPAKAATVYRFASISKPITATAVMQLVERGRIDLDAPIAKYVPAFPEKQWTVTVRQLLGHQGGIRHYRPGEELATRHYDDLAEPLKLFQDDPLLFEPGTRFLYTTYGFNLLGAAVETASGMPFPEYLRVNIFRRAGMETARADDVHAIIANRAQGYRRTAGGRENSAIVDTSNKIPGGGLCGTVIDLARFAIALKKGALLRPASLEQMFTVGKTSDGKPTGYGLGWSVSQWKGELAAGHTGAQARVSTLLQTIPGRGFALAWMCNLEGVSPRVAGEIAELLLK